MDRTQQNSYRRDRAIPDHEKIPRPCLACGASVPWVRKYGRKQAQFCSRACINKHCNSYRPEDFFGLTSPEPNSGCWLWTGRYKGRADFSYGKFKGDAAHRYSYKMHKGEIKDGLCVCHRCDISICVNPSHLFLGTHLENMADCASKGRSRLGAQRASSKLTEADVVRIRQMHSEGSTQKDLGVEFDVSPTAIFAVVHRRTWRHI